MDILCISSQVAHGPVGNSAAVPALQQAGFTVLQVPTTVLSNHPGHAPPAGLDVPAATLRAMLDTLRKNGWLDRCGAVMTGYFRDAGQVEAANDAVVALKADNSRTIFLCDPVLGDDDTGLYVPLPVAEAIRDRLVPRADIVTPNRFELEWLTGKSINDLPSAVAACADLQSSLVVASSLPHEPGFLRTAAIDDIGCASVVSPRRDRAPHGTGDLLAGLFLADVAKGLDAATALGRAMAALEHVLDVSGNSGVLAVPRGLAGIDTLDPVPVDEIRSGK